MNSSRLNSPRRNKGWRIVTAGITSLILSWWIYSANWNHEITLPVHGRLFVAGTSSSGIYGTSYENRLGFDFESTRARPSAADYDRGFLAHYFGIPAFEFESLSSMAIIIPYWMILTLFLGAAYLLLPKSSSEPKKSMSRFKGDHDEPTF